VKIIKLRNNQFFLFLISLISLLGGSYFLIHPSIRALLEISINQHMMLILIFLIIGGLMIISYFDARSRNKLFWLFLTQKGILFFLSAGILFLIANLFFGAKIPRLLAVFFGLTVIAGFGTLTLSSLRDKLNQLDLRTKNFAPFILWGAIIIFIFFYTRLCFLRFEAGLSNLFDLGNMEQAVWGTLHGYFLRSTTGALSSRLEAHVDPFLALFAPFYALWSSPKLLLLVQVIIAGAGALPLYLISQKLLKSSLAGLVFAFAYLISPILGAALLFDFHAITLVSSFLFFALYFLLEKRYLPYFIFILLALTCKEEVSLLIFLLGIYVYFKHNKKIGVSTAFLGLSWFLLAFFVIIPYFSGQKDNIFLIERYSHLGASQKDIVKAFIKQPGVVIKSLWDINKLLYVLYLILSFGGLMLFSPFVVLGCPSFLINILSNFWSMYSGGYHYSAPLLFYLLIGSIFGLKLWLKQRGKNIFYALLVFIFLSSLFYGYYFRLSIWGPQRERFNVEAAINEKQIKKEEIKKIKEMVPPDVAISTSGACGVFFAGRKNIYLFPRIDDAAYIVLDRPIPLDASNSYADYLRKLNNQLFQNKDFEIIFKGNYYLVGKRK